MSGLHNLFTFTGKWHGWSVWPNGQIIGSIFGQLQHWIFAPNHRPKFAKVSAKFCKIEDKLFQNGQSFITACQSGEISPNLVTLLTIQPEQKQHEGGGRILPDWSSICSMPLLSLALFMCTWDQLFGGHLVSCITNENIQARAKIILFVYLWTRPSACFHMGWIPVKNL